MDCEGWGGSSGPKAYSLEQSHPASDYSTSCQLSCRKLHTIAAGRLLRRIKPNISIDWHSRDMSIPCMPSMLFSIDNRFGREFMERRDGGCQSLPAERDATSDVYQRGVGNSQESQWLHAGRVGGSNEKNAVECR